MAKRLTLDADVEQAARDIYQLEAGAKVSVLAGEWMICRYTVLRLVVVDFGRLRTALRVYTNLVAGCDDEQYELDRYWLEQDKLRYEQGQRLALATTVDLDRLVLVGGSLN